MKRRQYVTGIGWCWMQDGEVIEVVESEEDLDPESNALLNEQEEPRSSENMKKSAILEAINAIAESNLRLLGSGSSFYFEDLLVGGFSHTFPAAKEYSDTTGGDFTYDTYVDLCSLERLVEICGSDKVYPDSKLLLCWYLTAIGVDVHLNSDEQTAEAVHMQGHFLKSMEHAKLSDIFPDLLSYYTSAVDNADSTYKG